MLVIVEPYNSDWASQFEVIKQHLEKILQFANVSYKSIEHVGSTSVPGLAAKPRIDLDIIVPEDQVQPAISALEGTGLYRNLGELGIPQRYAIHFLPPADNVPVPRRSTYICVDGCQSLRNHLAVRDVCRTNPRLRDEYARVKLELSQQDWEDTAAYCLAKNEVIGRILTEAGMGGEVGAIRDANVQALGEVRDVIKVIDSETSSA